MTAGADWAETARRLLDAVRPPADAATGDAHGADCRWCPVCTAAAVLRGERPEVTAALADVLATTASVLRDLAGEPARPGAAAPEDGAAERDDEPGPASVQQIDIA